jgi:hypothetical protein
MNDVYFGCMDCKIYVDAGYRWAYWNLENAGAVTRGALVSAERVLSAAKYWAPPDESTSDWLLRDVFPHVRDFFANHATHSVYYGDEDFLMPGDDDYLDWLEVGNAPARLPRYFAEVLRLRSWGEVERVLADPSKTPWLFDHEELAKTRERFLDLVRRGAAGERLQK